LIRADSERLRSDQEIGENATRAAVMLPSSPRNVLLEGTSRRAPDSFVEVSNPP
jgi:hypothetical protein